MAVSMRDLDPAFQGAGQKAHPLSDFFRMCFLKFLLEILWKMRTAVYSFHMKQLDTVQTTENEQIITKLRVY